MPNPHPTSKTDDPGLIGEKPDEYPPEENILTTTSLGYEGGMLLPTE